MFLHAKKMAGLSRSYHRNLLVLIEVINLSLQKWLWPYALRSVGKERKLLPFKQKNELSSHKALTHFSQFEEELRKPTIAICTR